MPQAFRRRAEGTEKKKQKNKENHEKKYAFPQNISPRRKRKSKTDIDGEMESYTGPVHTTLEEVENAALFLRLGLPSTLIRHENGAFRKPSPQSGGIIRKRLFCVLV